MNMNKMGFGEWLGKVIEVQHDTSAVKVANYHYSISSIVEAAESIDGAMAEAVLQHRGLRPMESMMMQIMFDLAGFKGRLAAAEAYQNYLNNTAKRT